MTGLIIKNTGSDYLVRASDGSNVICKVKGSFRIKGIKSTSPVTVGDRVDYDATGYITNLHERKNYIVRKPTNLSKQLHIIAANLDQAILVVTFKNPTTTATFFDRFLATAEAYHIPTILVFNKMDLLNLEEANEVEALIALYENIGYQCLKMSATSGEGINKLQALLSGKISLLSGNSGVGKSTIINQIVPNSTAKVGEISNSHHKGMHTTTFSEMYELGTDTFLIDTHAFLSLTVLLRKFFLTFLAAFLLTLLLRTSTLIQGRQIDLTQHLRFIGRELLLTLEGEHASRSICFSWLLALLWLIVVSLILH